MWQVLLIVLALLLQDNVELYIITKPFQGSGDFKGQMHKWVHHSRKQQAYQHDQRQEQSPKDQHASDQVLQPLKHEDAQEMRKGLLSMNTAVATAAAAVSGRIEKQQPVSSGRPQLRTTLQHQAHIPGASRHLLQSSTHTPQAGNTPPTCTPL